VKERGYGLILEVLSRHLPEKYHGTSVSAVDELKLNSVALVRERTIPTEPTPFVGEVSANFLCIEGCRLVSAADYLLPSSRFSRPELILFLPSSSSVVWKLAANLLNGGQEERL
jgi:hypothetical protein